MHLGVQSAVSAGAGGDARRSACGAVKERAPRPTTAIIRRSPSALASGHRCPPSIAASPRRRLRLLPARSHNRRRVSQRSRRAISRARPPEAGIQLDSERRSLALRPPAPSRPLVRHENQVLHRGRGGAVAARAAAELRWQRCPGARRRAAARRRRRAGAQAAWRPIPASRAATAAASSSAAAPAAIAAAIGRTTGAQDAAQGLPVVQGVPARCLAGPSRGPVPHQCHQVGGCGAARGVGGVGAGRSGDWDRGERRARGPEHVPELGGRSSGEVRENVCWDASGPLQENNTMHPHKYILYRSSK